MTNDPIRARAASRRGVLAGAAGAALVAPTLAHATPSRPLARQARVTPPGAGSMNHVTMKDGARIYVKDWGAGPPVVFCHGWPLTADAWDAQMMALLDRGFRVIAHDRRGHGRSDQTSAGNDMDTYADDLATLLDALDVKGATLVGHSTGGGEVARYIGRHGVGRVARAVLISAVPPHLAASADNPHGAPMPVFDGLRQGLLADRAAFLAGLAIPFYGYNRPGAKPSQPLADFFVQQGLMGGIKAEYECIRAFSETDFTADLTRMTVPTLVLQGDDDQIVPIDLASRRTIKLLPKGTLKEIPGAPHGLCSTHASQVNEALLAFARV